ncbi:MAG: hypothetical protein AB7O77_14720 [Phycisphaerales bacterium]
MLAWTHAYDNVPNQAEDRVSDMLVDKDANIYLAGKSYNGAGVLEDHVTYSLDHFGMQRWIVGGNIAVNWEFYSGAAHGTDFAVAVRLVGVEAGAVNHAGDVCVLGQATELNASGAKVQRYTVVRYDQLIPP